jgi:hypothetical protein
MTASAICAVQIFKLALKTLPKVNSTNIRKNLILSNSGLPRKARQMIYSKIKALTVGCRMKKLKF